MDIKILGSNEIEVLGNISTVTDYQEIKHVVTDMLRNSDKSLVISIKDAFSITSSVIGFFLKLVYQDNVHLELKISDNRLLRLLEELRLAEAFNAVKA